MSRYFIGIDTSNYTTSAALADEDGRIVASAKRLLPVKDGEVGLRQSDAVFSHVRGLSSVIEALVCAARESGCDPSGADAAGGIELAAVGYSARPRDAEGSYMPCFLVGETAARTVAALRGVPAYDFSHQAGHVAAALYGSGAEHLRGEPFYAFHVSGGTTELLGVDASGRIELLGATADINAGQLIDRVGVMLGMHFPCGPELERAALGYIAEGGTLPERPPVCVRELHCNLSGIQNKAAQLLEKGCPAGQIALYTVEAVTRTLELMTVQARERYGARPFVYAGGVMSCSLIKERLGAMADTYFAPPVYSADNAAGTALLCRLRYLESEGTGSERQAPTPERQEK